MFQGIADCESKLPDFQYVITTGTKNEKNGAPSQTDKFFIKEKNISYINIRGREVMIRENAPDFVKFNLSDNKELRTVLHFTIPHPVHMRNGWESMADSLNFYLKAHQIKGIKPHPLSAPHCTGDGISAQRWDGNEYKPIKCLNYECPQRKGDMKECKPLLQLYLQLQWEQDKPWSNLPSPIVKYESKSWHNLTKKVLPFFRNLHNRAMNLGYEDYTFKDLPIKVTLTKRKSIRGTKVPAINIDMNGNFIKFLKQQKKENKNAQM